MSVLGSRGASIGHRCLDSRSCLMSVTVINMIVTNCVALSLQEGSDKKKKGKKKKDKEPKEPPVGGLTDSERHHLVSTCLLALEWPLAIFDGFN